MKPAPALHDVEAVTFDVGNTLITTWPSVGHIYAEIATRHGCVGATAELMEARFRAMWPARLHLTETRAGWEQVVDEVFEGLVDSPPSRTFFGEIYERFAQPDVWRIYDDVVPTLDRLAARGLRLAVVSNWDERLRALLDRLDLASRFETIVVSCEVGHAKPHPAIFAEAIAKLRLPANRILHIGDNAEADLHGARDAGLHALQILRTATEAGPDHLRSLLELFDRLSATRTAVDS
jgi:putative hydrolase of the HAD superfamily